jgi:hypothetical protein
MKKTKFQDIYIIKFKKKKKIFDSFLFLNKIKLKKKKKKI